jgi:hypothetical protein
MASDATVGYGSVLSTSATQGGTYTDIAQTVDLTGPEPEVGEINITNNDSPDNTKEYLPGMIEPGEMSFEVIYSSAQAEDLYTMFGDGLVHWFKETYPDGGSWTFPGFLNAFGSEAPTEDEAIRNTVGIKLTGKPVFAAGS